MSLSHQERRAIMEALLSDELTAGLRAEAQAGTVDPGTLHRRLSMLLNDAPVIQALETNHQRAVIGLATSELKRRLPKPVKVLGPGERVLKLSGQALDDWRRQFVKQAATPVAFLYEQARYSLALEPGHPRRRDLAWDLVNAAITAVRYTCILAIVDYIDGGASDAQLNRALVDVIRRPADGSWSALLWSPDAGAKHSLLSVLEGRATRVEALAALGARLGKSDVPGRDTFGAIKGLPGRVPTTVRELADSFVSFRNELVHGAYSRARPEDAVLERLGRVLDVLLAILEPVLSLPVVVARGDTVSLARGPALGSLDNPLDVLGDPSVNVPWEELPVLIDGQRRLVLSPWVTLADLKTAVARAAGDLDGGDRAHHPEVALSELCFFNRFEADLLHYLGFAARALVPHTDLVETELAEAAYQDFSSQLETLRLQSAPAAARKANPIQRFDALARFHGENFVGRADIIGNIERFINDPPSPMGVITAAPGMGKSAILTHFYRQHGGKDASDGWVFHFSSRADQRDNAVLGLRSLIAQAEQQRERNLEKPDKKPPLPWSYDDLSARFQEALAELGACMSAKGKPAVVVIDALDEQALRPGAPPESILGGVPHDIPENVVVIVSVRVDQQERPVAIDPGFLASPRGAPVAGAHPLGGLSPADAEALVREKLAEEKPELAHASQAVLDRVAEAARRSDDDTLDPFYLRFLADGVREGSVDLSEVGNVPIGLESFFDALWWGLDTSHDFLLHRVLGLLAEMEGLGTDALFAEALKKPAEDVARLRFGINKLLVQSGSGGDDVGYGLFHDRFRWYVQSRYRERDKAMQLHLPLLEACRAGLSSADHYAARYTTFHLAALASHEGLTADEKQVFKDELWSTMHDDRFIRRKFAALDDERAVIVDFTRAFEVFRPRPEDSPEDQVLKAGQVTWLADRCARTVAEVANLARARLHDYAREGDAVRVIQLAERAGSDGLRWMTLLRAANTMREASLDPSVLFEAMQATSSPELQWTDRAMLERLLRAAAAPDDVSAWVLECVPDKPTGRLESEAGVLTREVVDGASA